MSTKTRKKGPSPKQPNSGEAPARAGMSKRELARARARRKRRMAGLKTAGAVALGVVALGALFVLSNSGGSKGTGKAGEYEFVVGNPGPGEKAPPLQLPSTDGGMFYLASEHGSVLLYFQEGIMCQPCWDQIKDIEAEFSKFEALGVDNVVTITTDPLDALEQKAADEGLTSEVLADPGVGASREWGTAGIGMMGADMNGHSFILVNEKGEIEWRADYGGPPDHTMYLPVSNVLADMRAALGSGAP